MTRQELNSRMAELDVFDTKKSAIDTIDVLLELLVEGVKADGSVHLGNHFGTFKTATQKARSGKAMGVEFNTPAKQVIKFKPSTVLKAVIAE